MTPEITEEVVKAAMSAVEEDTIERTVKICLAYAEQHSVPGGSKITRARAGAAAHLAKIIKDMKRKS